jgi:hypothetical protein
MSKTTYGYSVNLDERGQFYADVRSEDGRTVFEVRSADSDDESDLVQDGFMSNWLDIAGLSSYLEQMGVIENGATIWMLSDAESHWEEQAQDDLSVESCRP